MPSMRRPTSTAAAYAWHRAALINPRTPVIEDEPQCGWFRRRLVKGGSWVPGRIWIERELTATGELACDEQLRCEVLGEWRDPIREWAFLASNPITEAAYEHLCRLHQVMPAMAATMIPFDISQQPMRPTR